MIYSPHINYLYSYSFYHNNSMLRFFFLFFFLVYIFILDLHIEYIPINNSRGYT